MKVSVIGYGNWQTSDNTKANEEDYQIQKEAMIKMHAAGVNFFDTAEVYGGGVCEEAMGRAFKEMNVVRKDIVVSTKLYYAPGTGQNRVGLSRKKVIEGMRNSLKRLQLEYADIVFAHRPDYDTPLEEQVRAFSWLIDNGLTRYWGTSEWPATVIE